LLTRALTSNSWPAVTVSAVSCVLGFALAMHVGSTQEGAEPAADAYAGCIAGVARTAFATDQKREQDFEAVSVRPARRT